MYNKVHVNNITFFGYINTTSLYQVQRNVCQDG